MMESKFTPNSLLPLQKSEFTGSDDAELTSLTIGQYFKNVVDNYGDNPAIIVKHQDVSWTYQQYWYEVERVACGLLANGVEPGDRVVYGLRTISNGRSYRWPLRESGRSWYA